MGAVKDGERNDAKTIRIVEACYRAMLDPRVPVGPLLQGEGVHPDNIARLNKAPITIDSIARLLNYQFHLQTFAVVHGRHGRGVILRLADGHNYTPNTVVWEAPR